MLANKMEFANHNDLDLILKLEHHGRPIRVADCTRFAVKVWTQNQNNFLLFTSRDVIKDGRADRLVIAGYQMAALESGVVVYEYSYSLNDRHFRPFEGHNHQDHTKRVVTDIYWKNCNLNQVPSNPINFESLNHLRNLIEQEVADRENAIIDLRDYFNESYIDGLRDEIARSTAKDEELKALIDENKTIADGCVDALLEKIEGEIKRSNEVDIELFNAIKKAGSNTDEIKEETDNKINETNTALDEEVERAKGAEKELSDNIVAEADRAKAAEREINTALTDEVSRAKTKEAEIDATISAEVARAKVVEGALSDAVDAVRDRANQIASDLAAEVSRSNQLDNTHTAALNDEVTRAKAAEKALGDRLDVIEGDKTVVGSLAHCLEDAKHYVDDMIGKVTTDELKDLAEVNNALNAEISRAQTKEGELQNALDILNGDKETIGSVANAVEGGKKYTDEAIAKTLSDHNTDLTDLTNGLNTEVSRAQSAEKAIADRLDAAESNVATLQSDVTTAKSDISGLGDTIASETSRAQSAEKALGDRLDIVETGMGNAADAILNLTSADNDLSNALASEVSRATTKENEIDSALAVINGNEETIGSIKHALEDSKHYTDNQIATLKSQTSTDLADALKPYATKEEVDGRIEGIIGTAPSALDTLGEIADRLAEDSDAIAAINGVLSGKVNKADVYTKDEADAKHTQIATDITALNGAIENEVSRATAAEGVITNSVNAVDAKVDAVKATADTAAADLTDEINRAKAAETANTNAISALDTKVDGVKTIADKAASDIADLSTEVTGVKSDLNGLSNALATETSRAQSAESIINDTIVELGGRVTAVDAKADAIKATADKAAADLVDEASRAKAAENGLANDLSTLTSDLAAETSRATVKEGELESGVSANATAIASLATRTSAVETALATSASDLTAEVNRAKQAEGDLSNALASEVSRAQTKEGEIDAALAIINGDETVIGSVAHAEADAKHYTDDEIAKVNAKIDAEVVGFAQKSEVAAVDAKVDALKTKVDAIEAPDLSGYYDKAEVDQMIEDIDVTDQLTDYAKKSETTVIKDENGVVITEMVIDNSEADDTIEVYTKQQCDELFAKVVTLTQAEYDALTVKAPNTLYIVNG